MNATFKRLLLSVFCIVSFHNQMEASLASRLKRLCTKAKSVRPVLARALSTNRNFAERGKVAGLLSNTARPFSLQDYSLLTAEQRNIAHDLAQERLHITNPELPHAPELSHPTLDKEQREALVEKAKQLDMDFPHHAIVGLGQSPSYLIETAAAIAALKKNGNSPRYSHVAFSGCFQQGHLTARSKALYFAAIPGAQPTVAQTQGYRYYLKGKGLSPEAIANDPYKTLIVDSVFTGGGLASFLSIMQQWAHQQNVSKALEKKVALRIYQGNECLYPLNYPFETHRSTAHSGVVTAFGHWYNHGENRLMPWYSKDQWNKYDPSQYQIPLFANLACFKMVDHVATQHAATQR